MCTLSRGRAKSEACFAKNTNHGRYRRGSLYTLAGFTFPQLQKCGPARAHLLVIDRDPKAVQKALAA